MYHSGSQYDDEEDIFAKAKEKSLLNYLESTLGVRARKSGTQFRMDACPSCGQSAVGSAKLVIKDDRFWSCWQCGEHGTIIDAALAMHSGMHVAEAAKEVLGGYYVPVLSEAQRQQQREADTVKRDWQVWVLNRIFEASRQNFDPTAWDYLVRTRGLDPRVVDQAWKRGVLAGLPANRDQATLWLRQVVGEQELRYAGLWKDDAPTPWIAGRPVVQFVDNKEFAEFRIAFKPENPKVKKSLGVGRPGTPYFWSVQNSDRCLVAEACLEQLAAISMGYSGHVIAMSGTGSWNIAWFKAMHARGVKVFDLAFNNDPPRTMPDGSIRRAGQDAQMELGKLLAAEGIAFMDASPKEQGDINDALLRRRARR